MRTILISGASVAGLSLAHWLRRHGFQPTLVEKAPALREGGQAIDIRGVAREVVERMGIMEAVRAHHTGARGIAFLNAKGKRAASMSADAFGHSGGIVAEIEILRGDLVRILHESAGDVEILYDDTITATTETPDGIEVTFAHRPARRFDMVVGADGVRSGVRQLTFGADHDLVEDLGYYMTYFEARTTLDLDGWELMYNLPAGNGVQGRVALVYPLGNNGRVRVMLAFVSPDLNHDRRDTDAQKKLLARVFAGAGWEVPNLIEQMWTAEDLYFERVGAVHVPEWYRGRTALLGDSAFGGSAGMGTSMAIVGAYVLAGELAAANGDHTVAFPNYDREMRPYVTRNLKRPPGGANGFAPRTRHGLWMRNKMTDLIQRIPGGKKIMGNMNVVANSITLKAYGGRSTPTTDGARKPIG
ncbi:FAD-dependent monooxygenase [Kibdelosporangium lantanae]